MTVTILGKAHLSGIARKTGKPYDNTVVHVAYPRQGVEGQAVETVWLSATAYPVESIQVGSAYALDRDRRGYVVALQQLSGK